MLYIHYTILGESLKEAEWHVGESPPNARLDDTDIKVDTVYADGHELEYIQAYFKNLPYMEGGRSNVWRGEQARFIFDNLDKQLPPSLKR